MKTCVALEPYPLNCVPARELKVVAGDGTFLLHGFQKLGAYPNEIQKVLKIRRVK